MNVCVREPPKFAFRLLTMYLSSPRFRRRLVVLVVVDDVKLVGLGKDALRK